MVNQAVQKYVLNKFCSNLSKNTDFASAYRSTEAYLFQQGIQDGEVLNYTVKYKPGFSFKVSMHQGKLHCTVTDGSETVRMYSHETYAELYQRGLEMAAILDKAHLTLAPLPDKDFIAEISKAEAGSVINFNNQTAVVCIKSDNDEKVFKRQFTGSLSNITIDSFRKSDSFIINVRDIQDLHYLYGKAYVGNTTTADLRVTHDSYIGQHIRNDIEQKISPSTSRKVQVGPMDLTVIKDKEGKTAWYDSENKHVDKDTVGVIFGWAKNTIPEISRQEWLSDNVSDGFFITDNHNYDAFLVSIKEAATKHDFRLITECAFQYAKLSNGLMTLSIDDLEQDEEGNFIAVTYAFKQTDKGQQIYKIKYENNNINGWPREAKEVFPEEFEEFCKAKFDDTYHSIVNRHERVIAEKIKEGHTKEEVVEEIIKTLNKRENYNFMGVTMDDINNVSEKVSMLLENASQYRDDRVGVDEFLSLDDLEEKDPGDN